MLCEHKHPDSAVKHSQNFEISPKFVTDREAIILEVSAVNEYLHLLISQQMIYEEGFLSRGHLQESDAVSSSGKEGEQPRETNADTSNI